MSITLLSTKDVSVPGSDREREAQVCTSERVCARPSIQPCRQVQGKIIVTYNVQAASRTTLPRYKTLCENTQTQMQNGLASTRLTAATFLHECQNLGQSKQGGCPSHVGCEGWQAIQFQRASLCVCLLMQLMRDSTLPQDEHVAVWPDETGGRSQRCPMGS